MKLQRNRLSIFLVCMIFLASILVPINASAISGGEPVYGTAVIDGSSSEWNLSTDFFSNMYRAGNASKPLESKAYLRYDSSTQTVYMLVLSEPGVPGIKSNPDAWTSLLGTNGKLFTGATVNDGTPPDFAWVGVGFDGDPTHVLGYEASFKLDVGSYRIVIHLEVFDDSANQTSATESFHDGIPLILTNNVPTIIPDPSVSINVLTNGTDGSTIIVGSSIQWTYSVTNTGNVPLTNVVITDSNGGYVGTVDLAVGETKTLTVQGTAVAGTYENIGIATFLYMGTSSISNSSSDPSGYFGADPKMTIELLTNGSDGPMMLTGSSLEWTYTVTNTGNVPLQSIQVVDSLGGLIGTIDLGIGESKTLTVPGTAGTGLYENIGTAQTEFMGIPVSTSDPSSYFGANPSISINTLTNGSDGSYILFGSPIQWTYTVTNTGNVDLTGVVVSDDQLGAIGTIDLAASESKTISFPGIAGIGLFENIGTAVGEFLGLTISSSDPTSYFGANPSIELRKLLSLDGGLTWLSGDAPSIPQTRVGNSVLYKFEVKNTGNVTLNNIQLIDTKYSTGTLTIPNSLDPNGTFSASLGPITTSYGYFTNTASVTGEFLGVPYTSSDSATYFGALVGYSQGGFAGRGTPGKIFDNNFMIVFPQGLTIGNYDPLGSPNGYKWESNLTGLKNLKLFLADGGTSGKLTSDLLNPTKGAGGALARQTITLNLNMAFSGRVSGMPSGYSDLRYYNSGDSLDGKTMTEILQVSNKALATGELPSGYTFGTLNTLISRLAVAFDNGIATPWAMEHLR